MNTEKGAGHAAARGKKKGKTKEEIFGCDEGGHAGQEVGARECEVFNSSVW